MLQSIPQCNTPEFPQSVKLLFLTIPVHYGNDFCGKIITLVEESKFIERHVLSHHISTGLTGNSVLSQKKSPSIIQCLVYQLFTVPLFLCQGIRLPLPNYYSILTEVCNRIYIVTKSWLVFLYWLSSHYSYGYISSFVDHLLKA